MRALTVFNSGILRSNSNKPESLKQNSNRRLRDVTKNNGRKLPCKIMNCQSAKQKITDIAPVIDQHRTNIIFGTESWLNFNITSIKIFPNGPKILRKECSNDSHCG